MTTQPHEILARSSTQNQLPATRPLTPGEFNTALVHLYRGEVTRANIWRTRLDGTTNWAVLTTGATLSFAFSNPSNTHVMILINSLLICFFLYIEARRYRYYDLWRARVRLLETEFFADLLVPQHNAEDGDHWRELMASDLLHPRFTISIWEAMGRRLRRNYSWIFLVLALSWNVKVSIHPFPTTDLSEILERAAIGPFEGPLVIAVGVLFNSLLILLGIVTSSRFARLKPSDEVQSRDETRRRMASSDENEWE